MKRMRSIRQWPLQKFRKSLLTGYILIIITALVFIPVLIPISMFASWGVNFIMYPHSFNGGKLPYGSGSSLEAAWHKEAVELRAASPEKINARLKTMKQKYPDAALYWVDSAGTTRLQLPKQNAVPAKWSAEDAISFMKNRVDADPFTVVAFIGGDAKDRQGFMVLELPRRFLKLSNSNRPPDSRFYGVIFAIMLGIFVLLSYLFFQNIRKRLLRLEYAMTRTGDDGIPAPIHEGRADEIGRLEQAFNYMIEELEESKWREREEEDLRKSLISHLSHDLRTPLTVMASHLYSLREEAISTKGRRSLDLMEAKISDLSGLMEHLLSYNLLSSGKYTLTLENRDVLRLVRESAAAWYPVWEKAGLEADIDLPDEPLYWQIDEQGFRRVLDNLFQNLVRHAGSGGYVGIHVVPRQQVGPALVISDRGPGMNAGSTTGGAGLGLQIVDLLLREMSLARHAESSDEGTNFYIFPAKNAVPSI